ncbi:MAG: hypothetical protein CL661_12345 [Bacteroidetes bacterium]|jgi:hypothetical protein|nr:hypothetical protein [Bacteroidota bacterium]|tara:strand:+ start:397 stop:696 length:300 start_codon:yes stop_codon:yes gene_type:complete
MSKRKKNDYWNCIYIFTQRIGTRTTPPDWVDDSKHLIDKNELKHHTDEYIRQLLIATFDEYTRRNIEDKERKEWIRKFSKIENDWGMILFFENVFDGVG